MSGVWGEGPYGPKSREAGRGAQRNQSSTMSSLVKLCYSFRTQQTAINMAFGSVLTAFQVLSPDLRLRIRMIRTKKFTNMAFQKTGAVDLSLRNTSEDLVKEAGEDKPEPSKRQALSIWARKTNRKI